MSKGSKNGYCTWCGENTEHGYYASSFFFSIGHLLVRLLARLGGGGYGPWYCTECRRVLMVIEPPVEIVDVQQSGTGERGKLRVASRVVRAGIPQASDLRRSLVSPIQQPSIPEPGRKSSQYSQKYRFAIAERLIGGQATFKQVSEELSISKSEIWSWLVENFQDNRHQISKLKNRIRSLEDLPETSASDVVQEQQVVYAKPETDLEWSTIVVVGAEKLDSC